MARFLIRRILLGLFTMWLVTVGVFLIFFVGGGPNSVARRLAWNSRQRKTSRESRISFCSIGRYSSSTAISYGS